MRRLVTALPPHAIVASILVFALMLRVVFFIGLVSGDPQDDGIYYGNALALYNDGSQYLDQYRHKPEDFVANPIDQFNVRPMVTYPIAASFLLFGPGEIAATLWSLVCSLISVLVVYRLGLVLHGQAVGLVAALLCAVYPLEVINGTRILSDVQVGLFSSLALLSFVEGAERRRPALYLLSGVAAAAAYLANGRGLIFLIALLGCTIVMAAFRRVSVEAPLFVLGGFLAVFGLEAVIYFASTGDPLLSYHIQSGASRFKYLHEPVSSTTWGWLHLDYTNGAPFEVLRHVFLIDTGPTNQFGFFFYLFCAAALFSLLRRQNLLLVSLAIGLFVYFEFGPLRLSVDWSRREVHYMMVFKQLRFLMMLTAPLLVMSGYLLVAVGRRSSVAAVLLTVVLFATSLAAVTETRSYYRAGLADLRSAARDVRAHPDKTFFGDLWAILHLRIFTGYKAENVAVLDAAAMPDRIQHGCIMLGGSRGAELLAGFVESTLPPFARTVLDGGEVPEGWRLLREIKGERSPLRRSDFKIYCLP